MFNIDYIKVFEGTHQRIRKNLKVGHEYRFEETLEPDFFMPHISVHAIVGKNGSGKSTLLEILFRLVNNLSFALMSEIPREAADSLCYVFGLYAEMGWHEDGTHGVLKCEGNIVHFEYGDFNWDFEVMEQAGMRIFTGDYEFRHYYQTMKDVADRFFYTLVMNYSMQSYVAQDYVGEEAKSRNSNRHKTWNVKDVWINSLFHKNDGYMCPININPYRNNGAIDMNKEMQLTRGRIAALLQYFKYRGEHLINGYQLWDVMYTYNPYIINGYFDSDSLLERYNLTFPPKDGQEEENRWKNRDADGQKLNFIVSLFKKALDVEGTNVAKATLDVFDVDTSRKDESYIVGLIYLICKVMNIGQTYPTYILYTKSKVDYDPMDMLEVSGKQEQASIIVELARKIKDEESHVTLKVHRTLTFLHNYGRIRQSTRYGLEGYDEDMGVTSSEYLNAFDDRRPEEKVQTPVGALLSLKELELCVPPSIYEQHVYLVKELPNGRLDNKKIEVSQMSSGERQFIFSVSSIIYHMTNLLSVEDSLPKYHCFNLVIDEVEICFHPEYQRTFLKNLLRLLDRLEFNSGDRYINILLTTHSPFLLSDIPESHILYMTQDDELPTGKTFGANIYDLLNQQFFMNNTIGEFAAQKINDVVTLYGMKKRSERRERQFRENYNMYVGLYKLIGDDYLRKVVLRMVSEMSRQYDMEEPIDQEDAKQMIKEYENEIRMLRRRAGIDD